MAHSLDFYNAIIPKLGQYIYPLPTLFEGEGFSQLRGYNIDQRMIQEFLSRLRCLESLSEANGTISKIMAWKIAQNPRNKQTNATLNNWETNFDLRLDYWEKILFKTENALTQSAKNMYEEDLEHCLTIIQLRDNDSLSENQKQALDHLITKLLANEKHQS